MRNSAFHYWAAISHSDLQQQVEKRKGAPLLIWETASQLEKFGKGQWHRRSRRGERGRLGSQHEVPPPHSYSKFRLAPVSGGGFLELQPATPTTEKKPKSRIWHPKMAPMSSPLSDIPLHLHVPRGGEKRIATTRQNFLEIVPFYSPSPQFPDLHKRF